MAVTEQDILHIAQLARLKVDQADVDNYTSQLNSILALLSQMNQFDTDGLIPMSHPQDANLRLREDEVTAEVYRDELLALAPESHHGLYVVPQVIE